MTKVPLLLGAVVLPDLELRWYSIDGFRVHIVKPRLEADRSLLRQLCEPVAHPVAGHAFTDELRAGLVSSSPLPHNLSRVGSADPEDEPGARRTFHQRVSTVHLAATAHLDRLHGFTSLQHLWPPKPRPGMVWERLDK